MNLKRSALAALTLAAVGLAGCGGQTASHSPSAIRSAILTPRCHGNQIAMQCVLPPAPRTLQASPIPIVKYGIDFAWNGVSAQTAYTIGARFGASYLSGPTTKDWTAASLAGWRSLGLPTVMVWETTGTTPLGGFAAGVSDARRAIAEANALGLPADRPIYFACDWDETPAQAAAVAAYFQGTASIIGKQRTGAYGSYWVIKRLFDAGLIAYGWQTYAWSGGNWDRRAQLEQYNNASAAYDWDRAITQDYGQTPYTPPTPTPVPKPKPKPVLTVWQQAFNIGFQAGWKARR